MEERATSSHFGDFDYPGVSVAIAGFEKRLETDRELRKRREQLIIMFPKDGLSATYGSRWRGPKKSAKKRSRSDIL